MGHLWTHGQGWALAYSVRISILCHRLISLGLPPKLHCALIPPGAVGGRYGSGCLHLSSSASVSCSKTYRPLISTSLFAVSFAQLNPLVVVSARLRACWHQRAIVCTEPDHARYGDELPSQEKALGFDGRESWTQVVRVLASL